MSETAAFFLLVGVLGSYVLIYAVVKLFVTGQGMGLTRRRELSDSATPHTDNPGARP